MMENISRRHILRAGGLLGAGYVVNLFSRTTTLNAAPSDDNSLPWVFHPLNATETAQLAYDSYPGHGCMYAVVTSVVSQLAEKHQAPYNQLPVNMLNYGHGGVGGYGSLCGALNGAAMLIGLFCHEKAACDSMISNLYKWYEQHELPLFKPNNSKYEEPFPTVATHSVICHASVSNWCMKAMAGPDDPYRTERCRRLCGDVVIKTLEILENYTAKNEIAGFHLDENSLECQECHGISEAKMFKANTKMSCGSCHTTPHELNQ